MANIVHSREYTSNVVRVLNPTQNVNTMCFNVDANNGNTFGNVERNVTNSKSAFISRTYPEKSKFIKKERTTKEGSNVFETNENVFSMSNNNLIDSDNTSQLDTLLDDLKNEREISTNNALYSENNSNTRNINASYFDSNTYTNKNALHPDSNTYKNEKIMYKNVSSLNNKINQLDNSTHSNLNTTFFDNCVDINEKNLKTYTNNSKIVEKNSDITKNIKEISLSEDILPLPGTKVTTTVRTYTYEVPLSAPINLYQNGYNTLQNNINKSSSIINTYESENLDQLRPVLENNNVTVASHVSSRNISQNFSHPQTINIPFNNIDEIGFDQNRYKNDNTKTIYNPSKEKTNEQNIKSNTDNPFITTHYSKVTSNFIDNVNQISPKNINVQPTPFPTDEIDKTFKDIDPPRRLDDLMASFENNDSANKNLPIKSEHRYELNTSVANPGTPVIEKSLTKNVKGLPVYYPPGQEMFVKKEEGGWKAQGGYANASGKYEYAAESSSKSKSRSGAAVVPVCLPLCCAMPCSIM